MRTPTLYEYPGVIIDTDALLDLHPEWMLPLIDEIQPFAAVTEDGPICQPMDVLTLQPQEEKYDA